MIIICYQVLPSVGFCFQYQLINLAWLSFYFFLFSWSLTIYFFVQLHKSITKCLLFIIIHIFSTHFGISHFFLHNFKTQTNYGTVTAPCMWTTKKKKKNQVTSHSNCPRVLLLDLVYKHCNSIMGFIKGWLHCLT